MPQPRKQNPKKNPTARRTRPAKPPVAAGDMGLLNDEHKAKLVAQFIAGLQEQRFQLDLLRTANKHAEFDIVPGMQPEMSYTDRARQLDEACGEVMSKHKDLMPLIKKMIAGG